MTCRDRRHGRSPLARVALYVAVVAVSFPALLLPFATGAPDIAELLRGTDDAMRLLQVREWLDGKPWTDLVERRLNPPDGTPMHWSRLADLPLAAVAAPSLAYLERDRALWLAALIVPPLLGAAFVALFFWTARPLAKTGGAIVPLLCTPALLVPLIQFRPGRIDHHGLQLVLVALAAGFLLRALASGSPRAAVGVGAASALSLAVGLENIPFVVVAVLAFGVALARAARPDAAFAAFGTSLAITLLVLFPVTVPPPEWTAPVCDRLSTPHLVAAATLAAAALASAAIWRLVPAAGVAVRLAPVAVVGLAGAVVLVSLFPQCAGSPYATLSPEVLFWFERVSEARSLGTVFTGKPGTAIAFMALPTLALLASGGSLLRTRPGRDPSRIALFALVVSGIAMACWQVRATAYAGFVAAVALVPLAAAVDRYATSCQPMLARVGVRCLFPAACVVATLGPVLPGDRTDADEDALYRGCQARDVVPALNDPTDLGRKPLTVAAPIDLGPRILLLTDHAVLAAPYHRNVRGLADNRLIFGGTEAEALTTVVERGVAALVFCRAYAAATAYPGKTGFLAEHLANGGSVPWLVPVVRTDDMGLYRVDLGRGLR